MTQIFNLPWPPSTNSLWRAVRGRNILSAGARAFKEEAGLTLMVARAKLIRGKVGVAIILFPPDRRRFDIDNRVKAILDSLKGVVIEDDWMVDELHVARGGVDDRGGVAVVTVVSLEEAEDAGRSSHASGNDRCRDDRGTKKGGPRRRSSAKKGDEGGS